MLGIGPQYYLHIYIIIVTVLSFIVFLQYSHSNRNRKSSNRNQSANMVVLLSLFFIVFIGFRPVSGVYFVDMANYSDYYHVIQGEPFDFDWKTDNLFFDNYLNYLASRNSPIEILFGSLAAIYFGCMAYACSKLFPNDKMAAYLVYLGAFSTFSYGTNGIKAGAAASLFLVALALYENRQWIWMIVFLLFSIGFHHSMIMPIACFVVCLLIRNPKVFFIFWLFCLLIAAFHITIFQELFASITDEQGAAYLSGREEYVRHDILGGFRIDFILYSFLPIIIGLVAIYKKRIRSRKYVFLLNLYVLSNSIWLLCMYAEYTNRIAYLSWLMLPIVLIYPFLRENWGRSQYQSFQWVALGHIGFTLFMQYIYY